jgi:hypothetical protein
MANAKSVATRTGHHVSVQPYRGGYLMVSKVSEVVTPDIDGWWSPTPVGPWQHLGTLHRVPEPPRSWRPGYRYRDAYTYMASVYPQARLNGGRVLLAYNVGSFDERDGVADALMYGPRFVGVRVPPVGR